MLITARRWGAFRIRKPRQVKSHDSATPQRNQWISRTPHLQRFGNSPVLAPPRRVLADTPSVAAQAVGNRHWGRIAHHNHVSGDDKRQQSRHFDDLGYFVIDHAGLHRQHRDQK